ncbi:MAG: neutral/alkaline non-lysosomal ceramidase N-terminal domain-containing protein [candidate division KSB1 bacterium]|nr:neutral/alkaline non-lysosomal ceramidase N-terminal domain-containing protein [candidate division KSB1 bacterium]MDQ7064469.1 neutral/alkaline non-lysosomal ceramidase N-terminal domain-containing protein [candidate division KSB1 bacterium]
MQQRWEMGFAMQDITPPPGIHLAGYALRQQGNIGVLDPVFVRALALTDGDSGALILSCDLLGLEYGDIRLIKQEIQRHTELPVAAIFIAATHTHSAPASMYTIGIGDRDEAWMQCCLESVVAAGLAAWKALRPARLRRAIGETDIGINRRARIEKGSIHPAPDPYGVVDRMLTVLLAEPERAEHAPLVMFHCGCHPTILGADNRKVSADFPGAAIQYLKTSLGPNTEALFLNGAAGNVNPRRQGNHNLVRSAGLRLRNQLLQTLDNQSAEMFPQIGAVARAVTVPYAPFASGHGWTEAIAQYEHAVKAASSEEERVIQSACLAWARRMAQRYGDRSELQVELQALRIGEMVFLALPFEVFAETSLAIRQAVSEVVVVCGYANGNFGYLPPAAEIPKGGYEVLEAHKFYGHPNHFAVDAEERVRRTAVALIAEVSGGL